MATLKNVGLDAAKHPDPKPGMEFTATDTGRLYRCYVQGTWRQEQPASGGAPSIGTWQYDTSLIDADPGNGKFRLNDADPSVASEIFLDDFTQDLANYRDVLLTLETGDFLHIQKETNQAVFQLYRIEDGARASTGYVRYQITAISSGTAFALNDACVISILRRAPVRVSTLNPAGVAYAPVGEKDLMTHALPENTLNQNPKGVRITAWGTIANNANAKTLRVKFGATTILTFAMPTGVAGVWYVDAVVIRTGAAAQDAVARLTGDQTTILDAEITTPAEDTTAQIIVKCTGDATAGSDIVQEGLLVETLGLT